MDGARLRRRLRWSAVVAAATVAVGPAASAAAPTTYTVTAAGSAWVDVTISRPVELDVSASVLTATGAYRGFFVQPLGERPDSGVGILRVTRLRFSPERVFVIPLGNPDVVGSWIEEGAIRRHLEPGRYRVHVFADGPVTARVVLRGGGPNRSLRATAPSKVTTAWRDLVPTIAGTTVQPAAVTGEVPLAVRSPNSLTFVAMFMKYRTAGTFAGGYYNACLGPADVSVRCQVGGPAADGPGPNRIYTDVEKRITHPPTLLDEAILHVGYYLTGTAVAGQRQGNFAVALSAALEQVTVGAFSLAY